MKSANIITANALVLFLWVLSGPHAASAVVVDANWGTNSTSISNVSDASSDGTLPTDRLRLSGGQTTGFIEGTVNLPFDSVWAISTGIQTDGQNNLPAEFVKIFINDLTAGSEVATFFNTPLNTLYIFTHVVTGTAFDYRFEFSSPSADFGAHLIVEAGTVSAIPLPAALPLFAGGLGLLGLIGWRCRASSLEFRQAIPPFTGIPDS